MRPGRSLLGALALGAAAPLAAARPVAVAAAQPTAAAAHEEARIGSALAAVYAVISGPAGKPRDWARMRTLYTPEARLTAITTKGISGGTVEDYIARSGPSLVKSGFTERELARRVEIFGNLAHAWSSYEGTGDGGKLKVRGINSVQLVRVEGRWLVQSILWQAENAALPLPADMAAGSR